MQTNWKISPNFRSHKIEKTEKIYPDLWQVWTHNTPHHVTQSEKPSGDYWWRTLQCILHPYSACYISNRFCCWLWNFLYSVCYNHKLILVWGFLYSACYIVRESFSTSACNITCNSRGFVREIFTKTDVTCTVDKTFESPAGHLVWGVTRTVDKASDENWACGV